MISIIGMALGGSSRLLAAPLLFGGGENASERECAGEPDQSGRCQDGRNGMPAKVLDPQAERGRAGKLTETAGLLHEPDGRRHRRRRWGRVRSRRIDCAWRKTTDSER
jgi:hypothetical protein